jgi:hypothetical protein
MLKKKRFVNIKVSSHILVNFFVSPCLRGLTIGNVHNAKCIR